MQPVETIRISDTVRVQMYPDTDCSNPLDDWDHGVQFIALPDPSRTWCNYKEPTSNTYGGVAPVELDDWGEYREFNTWEPGYDYESSRPAHMSPSLITFLDTHAAAWFTIDRNGYDGTIGYNTRPDADSLQSDDAIALVSRAMFRAWHGIPADKPMPKGYRQQAKESLRAVLDEYNRWATGECYGYVVERHAPDCDECYELSPAEWPAQDCAGWTSDDTDSCWGFIGYEYAEEEATHAGMQEANIPIPQVTKDRKGITLQRAEGVPNTESPDTRTLYPCKPLKDSPYKVAWTVRTEYRANPREYKDGYNTYTARAVNPEYIKGTDLVRIHFTHPTVQDSIVMHRLQWQSAQDTMKALAGRS